MDKLSKLKGNTSENTHICSPLTKSMIPSQFTVKQFLCGKEYFFLPAPFFFYKRFVLVSLPHPCISRQTCLQHPKIHRLKILPIMHHWMQQILINCTLLHHHLSLSGKTQVSLCDKSPNQYISLGLQVICS